MKKPVYTCPYHNNMLCPVDENNRPLKACDECEHYNNGIRPSPGCLGDTAELAIGCIILLILILL